jgi:hypothetical protein
MMVANEKSVMFQSSEYASARFALLAPLAYVSYTLRPTLITHHPESAFGSGMSEVAEDGVMGVHIASATVSPPSINSNPSEKIES